MLDLDYVDVGVDTCLVNERCVRSAGVRKVIRFDTTIANVGTALRTDAGVRLEFRPVNVKGSGVETTSTHPHDFHDQPELLPLGEADSTRLQP